MTPRDAGPAERLLQILANGQKRTTRQITDALVAEGFVWRSRSGRPLDVTFDRVHDRLVSMLLKGQVRRKKSMGVWIWSA